MDFLDRPSMCAIVGSAFALLFNCGSVAAAEFLPEAAIPLTANEIAELRDELDAPLAAGVGEDVIAIGDMLFRSDNLLTSGFSARKWTRGEFIYEFDQNISDENRERFREACAVWEDVSAVQCIERTEGQANYAYIMSSQYNRSYVGMIGGPQNLEIFNWHWKYIIAHEIGHALGLSHEQSRSDRDTYVEILFSNIRDRHKQNFKKEATTNHTPYDFRSIMHYRSNAFSINGGPTIQPRAGYESEAANMGNRSYLSGHDAAGMASQYGQN